MYYKLILVICEHGIKKDSKEITFTAELCKQFNDKSDRSLIPKTKHDDIKERLQLIKSPTRKQEITIILKGIFIYI